MPTIFSHPAAALAFRGVSGELPQRALLAGVLLSIVPDVDTVGFRFGIPYGSMLGHRGLTHSLLFAALLGLAVALAYPRGERVRLFTFFSLCVASHGFFDAMTDGGRGVAFFAPFSAHRYFLPWRPIAVSPIGAARFLRHASLLVLQSELLWVWLPCLAVGAVAVALRRRRVKR
jgi:inner membrane protein